MTNPLADIITAARERDAAAHGWKRLGDYCDPKYVGTINGTAFVITDLRGYDSDHPWVVQTVEQFDNGDNVEDTFRTLADAKRAAAGWHMGR